jgi:hypothetical protein
LPVVAEVADSYADEDIAFLAVAGRSDFDSSAARAEELFGDRLLWGLDDSIWDLYGIPYQPVTVLITGGDTIVDAWPGALEADVIRERIDNLIALSS